MILFSDRMRWDRDFANWCQETGAANCALNFLAYLQTRRPDIIVKLAVELMEGQEAMKTKPNIPTVEQAELMLFNQCIYVQKCCGLADGYNCPDDCPLNKAKEALKKQSQ